MDNADEIINILNELKKIRDYRGELIRVKKPPSFAALLAHVKEFYLEKRGSYTVDDPEVIDAARKLAAERDNSFSVALIEGKYELYTMMEESKIN